DRLEMWGHVGRTKQTALIDEARAGDFEVTEHDAALLCDEFNDHTEAAIERAKDVLHWRRRLVFAADLLRLRDNKSEIANRKISAIVALPAPFSLHRFDLGRVDLRWPVRRPHDVRPLQRHHTPTEPTPWRFSGSRRGRVPRVRRRTNPQTHLIKAICRVSTATTNARCVRMK